MCYRLGEHVRKGAQAVPFLVKMARGTKIYEGVERIPFQEEFTEQTRKRDAIPWEMAHTETKPAEKISHGKKPETRDEPDNPDEGEQHLWHQLLLQFASQ